MQYQIKAFIISIIIVFLTFTASPIHSQQTVAVSSGNTTGAGDRKLHIRAGSLYH